jgi:hypothetical protein
MGVDVVQNSKITASSDIGKYSLGRVVMFNAKMFGYSMPPDPEYGHVIGFSINSAREVIIAVKWCDGETSNIHPKNLYVYD